MNIQHIEDVIFLTNTYKMLKSKQKYEINDNITTKNVDKTKKEVYIVNIENILEMRINIGNKKMNDN